MDTCIKCSGVMTRGGSLNSGNAEYVTMLCPSCGCTKTVCTGVKKI